VVRHRAVDHHFPKLLAGQCRTPSVHELTQSVLDTPVVGDNWTGTGSLNFFAAPGEELAVVRTGAGYRGSLSCTVTTLRMLTGPDAG
jgi:hypothetical protein